MMARAIRRHEDRYGGLGIVSPASSGYTAEDRERLSFPKSSKPRNSHLPIAEHRAEIWKPLHNCRSVN
jgi:hypothetical protein